MKYSVIGCTTALLCMLVSQTALAKPVEFCGKTYALDSTTVTCNLRSVTSVGPLARLTSVKSLELSSTSVSDLQPLSKLKHLEFLGLNSTKVADLKPLAKLPQLRILYLSSTEVKHLRPLAGLKTLETLSITYTGVANLKPLNTLTRLESLRVDGTKVSNLTPISTLANLTKLSLRKTPVTSLAPIGRLGKLKSLEISQSKVSEFEALRRLTQLEVFNAAGTAFSDTSVLAPSLQFLQLANTQVSDLRPLSAQTQLMFLDLKSTKVVDLAPLARLTKLNHLELSNTAVAELAPLAGVAGLRKLYLNQTKVSDLGPLHRIKLSVLEVSGSPISEASLSAFSKAVPGCALHDTRMLRPLTTTVTTELTARSPCRTKALKRLFESLQGRFSYCLGSDVFPLPDRGVRGFAVVKAQVRTKGRLLDLKVTAPTPKAGQCIKDVLAKAKVTGVGKGTCELKAMISFEQGFKE